MAKSKDKEVLTERLSTITKMVEVLIDGGSEKLAIATFNLHMIGITAWYDKVCVLDASLTPGTLRKVLHKFGSDNAPYIVKSSELKVRGRGFLEFPVKVDNEEYRIALPIAVIRDIKAVGELGIIGKFSSLETLSIDANQFSPKAYTNYFGVELFLD